MFENNLNAIQQVYVGYVHKRLSFIKNHTFFDDKLLSFEVGIVKQEKYIFDNNLIVNAKNS